MVFLRFIGWGQEMFTFPGPVPFLLSLPSCGIAKTESAAGGNKILGIEVDPLRFLTAFLVIICGVPCGHAKTNTNRANLKAMKSYSIYVGIAVITVVSIAYVPMGWLKGISNRQDKEPSAEPQLMYQAGAATPVTETPVSPDTGYADADGKPDSLERDIPKTEGDFSAPIRLYLDDLSQMVTDMKQVTSAQDAAIYENKLRTDMPRMSTNALACVAAVVNVEAEIQNGKITSEIVHAGEMLNDFEVKGSEVEAEMVRLEAICPTIKMLFDQYRSLHD